MLTNTPFTFHYRAPNSPSLFTEHLLLCFVFTKYHVQVDLGTPRLVTSIATQGKRFTLYVKTYKLGSSDDGKTWTIYKESGTVKVKLGVPRDKTAGIGSFLLGSLRQVFI